MEEFQKWKFADLQRMGIVNSRPHLKDLIARGVIRPPHKDGKHPQSSAWWYATEIREDLAAEKERVTKAA